jgi:hypothetical protein
VQALPEILEDAMTDTNFMKNAWAIYGKPTDIHALLSVLNSNVNCPSQFIFVNFLDFKGLTQNQGFACLSYDLGTPRVKPI